MGLFGEVAGLLGIAGGSGTRHARLPGPCPADAGMPQRELAAMMRHLPGRYADRLRPRILERITGDAAAGRWEQAVDQLITALCIHGEPITADEHTQLRTVLDALNMPRRRLDFLTLRAEHTDP